jgi:sec-independent protein translocase protein TatB
VFGVSFTEFLVLGTVALLVLGPDKLPGMLRTLGQWLAKLRKLTTEVRYQSGIDDVLRSEGLDGGLNELRGLMRGGIGGSMLSHATAATTPQASRASHDHFMPDKSREYPAEGVDAYGALPEDLVPGTQLAPAGNPVAAPAATTTTTTAADAAALPVTPPLAPPAAASTGETTASTPGAAGSGA